MVVLVVVAIIPDPKASDEATHGSGNRPVKEPQNRSANKP